MGVAPDNGCACHHLRLCRVCVCFRRLDDAGRPGLCGHCCCLFVLQLAVDKVDSHRPGALGLPAQLPHLSHHRSHLCLRLARPRERPHGQLISLFHADMDPDTPGSARCISMLLTCAMAASLNLSSARLIQYTSPLTYHVVGHGKLILILTFGVLFLNSPISLKVATGMLGAVVGVMWYTYIKYNE